ncbi:MAG: hypothetical protein LBU65_09495 [Planctomycetaceae bacterium]|jgi:hypothetical protein|nr:hypothetical protein [Planctomycetaceae bacterium]
MKFSQLPTNRFIVTTLFTVLFVVTITAGGGCTFFKPFTEQLSWQINAPTPNNPKFVATQDYLKLWATVYDVIDSHFDVAKSDPIRLYDGVLTEGRLTTKPKIAPSLLEPWHANSGSLNERCDSTLQTIQHRAVVRIVPEQGGFLIEVQVFKEIEAKANPLGAEATSANLRSDGASNTLNSRIDSIPSSEGWTTFDRDTKLEERLLNEILYRLTYPATTIRKSQEPIRG